MLEIITLTVNSLSNLSSILGYCVGRAHSIFNWAISCLDDLPISLAEPSWLGTSRYLGTMLA